MRLLALVSLVLTFACQPQPTGEASLLIAARPAEINDRGETTAIKVTATDAFGNVAQEASASGVVPIVSDKGGPKFLVDHGKSGFIAKDIEEFGKYTIELRKDRDKLLAMKEMARERALSKSWESVFEGVYEGYREAIRIAQKGKQEPSQVLDHKYAGFDCSCQVSRQYLDSAHPCRHRFVAARLALTLGIAYPYKECRFLEQSCHNALKNEQAKLLADYHP